MYLISLIIYFVYVLMKIGTSLQMLQQNFYNKSNRYLRWIRRNLNKSVITFDLLGIALFLILFLLNKNYYIIFSIFYGVMIIVRYFSLKNEQLKKPLVITFRVRRIFYAVVLFYTLILLFIHNENLIYFIFSVMASLIFIVVYFATILNYPIEKIIYFKYKRQAINKLKNMDITTIGITGSYGKTSSKNILNDILSVKYESKASPSNYNTPLGLMNTINNYLDKFDSIFVAEISATIVGEIKKSCDFVKPKYGILTNIGLAHLETFKSEENIQKTKFELIESLPSDGLGILNCDNPKQMSYKIKNNCRIQYIGIENKNVDLYATNIKYDSNGMSFDGVFKDKTVHFETKLLGVPNVYNILASLLIAKDLGLSYDEMVRGVKKIKPIEHRLELKKFSDVTIIDDAYNSNPVGSKMALDVLNVMDGLKIVVTPGMIELKDKQYDLNKKFGEYISEVADYVILVGEKQTKPIYDGLVCKKYDTKKIFVLNDVKEAFPLINRLKKNKTYALLENDLPDLFNER